MKTTIKTITLFTCFVLLFSSCLKDEPTWDWSKIQGWGVVELPYKAHWQRKTQVVPPTPVEFDLMLNYTIPDKKDMKEDIVVTLSVAATQAELDRFNKAMGLKGASAYQLLPAGSYTVPTTLTIPKGTQLIDFKVQVTTSGLDPANGKFYLIPVKIESASNNHIVSGNFGYLDLRIDLK